jgi:hypothetical protein
MQPCVETVYKLLCDAAHVFPVSYLLRGLIPLPTNRETAQAERRNPARKPAELTPAEIVRFHSI